MLATLIPLGGYHEITVVFFSALFIYVIALFFFRGFLTLFPLRAGDIPEGSQQEFVYHVYLLFYLILFYPILRSGFVPVPIMRLVYMGLGAKLGDNTYSSGIILDAQFVEIGNNSIVGQYALLVPHVIEGKKLAHYPIRMGNNVTIGAGATVLSGVTIGDGAIVSTGAVVTKGTHIGPGEIWGGIPAKLIGRTVPGDQLPEEAAKSV
jgi:acetyltransferase-like isoleucine patch superfamily enzyme